MRVGDARAARTPPTNARGLAAEGHSSKRQPATPGQRNARAVAARGGRRPLPSVPRIPLSLFLLGASVGGLST